MKQTIRQADTIVTQFGGPCPTVATADTVDVTALTDGDNDPMFVTLLLSELGRVSRNGLRHTETLMSALENQVVGKDALVGHIPPEDEYSAFPISDTGRTPLGGHWIGVKREGRQLWGKAYIPPGKFREYVLRLKAMKSKLGTSLYGQGYPKHDQETDSYELAGFELLTFDFVPHDQAALQFDGAFAVTTEIVNIDPKEGRLPDEITIADVPQAVREQIIRDANLEADAARVAELTQENSQLQAQVREMRERSAITAELYTVLGEGADVVSMVRQMHEGLTTMAELLGVQFGEVRIQVTELHRQVTEMAQEQFDRALDDAVQTLTESWQVRGERGQRRLAVLHNHVRQAALTHMDDERDPEGIAGAVQRVWQSDDVRVLAEMTRDSISGGRAIVGASNQRESVKTDEELLALGKRFVGKR